MGIFPSRAITQEHTSLSIQDACLLARSGDLLLISDTSINARLINEICAARWSHAAIIYRDPNRHNGRPCIFEAVMHAGEEIDVIKKRKATGVRLIDMEAYLNRFKGNAVAMRMLVTNSAYTIHKDVGKFTTSMMAQMVDRYHGKPYETRWSEFILARFPIIPRTSESPSAFFCSQLVAWCYINMGLIDGKSMASGHFLPEEFSSTGDLELRYPSELPFICFSPETTFLKLGEEMFIDTTKISV